MIEKPQGIGTELRKIWKIGFGEGPTTMEFQLFSVSLDIRSAPGLLIQSSRSDYLNRWQVPLGRGTQMGMPCHYRAINSALRKTMNGLSQTLCVFEY